jgi:microcystin-dependent protein
MATPYLGELRLMSFNFPPKGWASCNGQLLPINQNQALFALLGTTFGGNGTTTFALPDLRSRTPIGAGQHPLGTRGGEESHTLIASEMPPHLHLVQAVTAAGQKATPAGNFLATHRGGYVEAGDISFNPSAVGSAGGSQAHNNMGPYLVINFCIALQGIFPSQN